MTINKMLDEPMYGDFYPDTSLNSTREVLIF